MKGCAKSAYSYQYKINLKIVLESRSAEKSREVVCVSDSHRNFKQS